MTCPQLQNSKNLMMKSLAMIAIVFVRIVATGPCDIYNAAGTPCVAAHSMVRALYGSYKGPLYLVKRSSDNTTKQIGLTATGGFVDSAAQDAFCRQGSCIVQRIFDQSPKCNHLDIAPGGGANRKPSRGVNASRDKILVGSHSAYGAYFEGGMGYRNDNTSGIAKGDESESIYMVTAGTHYNGRCCFDYGNAETDDLDDGRGTMEALYFGSHYKSTRSQGTGQGPWVMTDLENGVWAGSTIPVNKKNTPIIADFATAMLKGKAGGFTLKGGNAQSGLLKTLYDGKRPDSQYNPMKKEGGIVLGIGGDNSNWAVGTFYEGVMTFGYASDATDNAVQANIVAAGYAKSDVLLIV